MITRLNDISNAGNKQQITFRYDERYRSESSLLHVSAQEGILDLKVAEICSKRPQKLISIRLIHGTLRAALNQRKAWGMLDRNPAVGVKLPRKKAVKPTVVLGLGDIRRIIEAVKEPTKSMLWRADSFRVSV